MTYNRIDILEAGWGTIYQGGFVTDDIDEPPFTDPVLIICMDRGEFNEAWINHATVEAVLAVWIEDAPTACLKDNVLLALSDAGVAWLRDGGNLYIHCLAGISRASYMDIAIHCRALGISAQEALTRIRAERSVANPNSGFLAQLTRLFPAA